MLLQKICLLKFPKELLLNFFSSWKQTHIFDWFIKGQIIKMNMCASNINSDLTANFQTLSNVSALMISLGCWVLDSFYFISTLLRANAKISLV